MTETQLSSLVAILITAGVVIAVRGISWGWQAWRERRRERQLADRLGRERS